MLSMHVHMWCWGRDVVTCRCCRERGYAPKAPCAAVGAAESSVVRAA